MVVQSSSCESVSLDQPWNSDPPMPTTASGHQGGVPHLIAVRPFREGFAQACEVKAAEEEALMCI